MQKIEGGNGRQRKEKNLSWRGGSFEYRRLIQGVNISITLSADSWDAAIKKRDLLNEEARENPTAFIKKYKGEKTTIRNFLISVSENTNEQSGYNQKDGVIGLTPKSVARYAAIRENFLSYCDKKDLKYISDITDKIVDQYFFSKITEGEDNKKYHKQVYASKTAKTEKEYLRKIFQRYAVDKQLISNNPFCKTIIKEKKYISENSTITGKYFEKDEVRMLLAAAVEIDDTLRAFGNCKWSEVLEFYFLTGLRENELIHLSWSNVKRETKTIVVDGLEKEKVITTLNIDRIHTTEELTISNSEVIDKFKQYVEGKVNYIFTKQDLSDKSFKINSLPIRTKNDLLNLKVSDIMFHDDKMIIKNIVKWQPKGAAGAITLNDRAVEILETIEKRTPKKTFVFSGANGGRIKTNFLSILERTMEKAGIEKGERCLHSTRHTMGTMLRDAGVALETIGKILRHKNLKDTLIYAPLGISEELKAVQTLKW